MNSIRKPIGDKTLINKALNWVDGGLCKIIDSGRVAYIEIGIDEPYRTLEQNSKQWAMFTDLEKQLTWHGQKMSREDWKDLLCHEWKAQKLIPAISGGFCVLNARTSKARKRQLSELIEIVYAFGSSNGVQWSEKALEAYESYREAQR